MSNPIAKADNRVVHPGETLQNLGSNERTVLDASDSVYVVDSDGNRLLDGPAGMWCVNVGYGRPEIIEAINKQLESLTYASPWAVANAPAAELAEVLSELSPGDLNHVFYTTGGSTAVDSALPATRAITAAPTCRPRCRVASRTSRSSTSSAAGYITSRLPIPTAGPRERASRISATA